MPPSDPATSLLANLEESTLYKVRVFRPVEAIPGTRQLSPADDHEIYGDVLKAMPPDCIASIKLEGGETIFQREGTSLEH